MIAEPHNDTECLGAISATIAQMIDEQDPIFAELAAQYPTTQSLIDHIRSLPQRDDLGDPSDGPREHACTPTQRVRFGAEDPNCVERAALFLGVEEMRDPRPTRQLATIDTPIGKHTLPLVNGRAVVLDPRVSQECADCGVTLGSAGPVAIEPRNAIAWTADMAAADAAQFRNGSGPSMIYVARNAIRRMVDDGAEPAETEIEAIGILLAVAERVARRYGTRALAMVRTTAKALAAVLDAVLMRRNISIDIGGYHLDTPKWLDDTATAAGKVGLDLGSIYLRSKLGALGIAPEVIGLLESHLGESGRTLGAFAHPPELATFAKFAAPRSA
jgi:hypothetical protein